MPRKYEIWEAITPDGRVSHVALLEAGKIDSHRHLFEGEPVLLMTFEAKSLNEAFQKRNDFFGWGKYIPMDDED